MSAMPGVAGPRFASFDVDWHPRAHITEYLSDVEPDEPSPSPSSPTKASCSRPHAVTRRDHPAGRLAATHRQEALGMNARITATRPDRGIAAEWHGMSDAQLLRHPDITAAWGIALAVDLEHCDPAAIRDGEGIARFAVELCERIDMRRFGPATVVRFGADPRVSGYSLVQLIETSLVSGHFAETSDAAYLDIFSCKPYPPHAVVAFCEEWFGGRVANATLTLRG
jgi:hypothetical protein